MVQIDDTIATYLTVIEVEGKTANRSKPSPTER